MKALPQISEAEFEVMKVIWKHAPISTNEITEKLTQTTKWSPKTIQTLIKRLVTKGALSYEKQRRVFVYTPLIEEKEYIGQESHSFLERYYDGDITAMLSAYIEDDKTLRIRKLTRSVPFSQRVQKTGGYNMANFGIRFFLCNIFICIIIGFLIIVKRAFKNYLTSGCSSIYGFCCLGFLQSRLSPFVRLLLHKFSHYLTYGKMRYHQTRGRLQKVS